MDEKTPMERAVDRIQLLEAENERLREALTRIERRPCSCRDSGHGPDCTQAIIRAALRREE